MPTEAAMKATLQAYLDAFNEANVEKIVGLFAADATVEDPVGTPPRRGTAELRTFYTESLQNGAKLSLAAPIRGSHGNAAAMAFDVKVGPMTVRVIDVMTFNDDGKVATMKAYFGPSDFSQG